jgi:NtrC-family two-component system sensor histidine kinase KinB
MLGLRQKLSFGFGGLLLIILIIGIQSIIHLTKLGESIDIILRENYRSVITCQQMKEALERMDSGILFELLGYTEKGSEVIRRNELAFEMALEVELHNITLPGEGERASHLNDLFGQYKTTVKRIEDSKMPLIARRTAYFTDLFPLFQHIKDTTGEILRMNQQNMSDANDLARNRGASARKQMYILLSAGTIIALGLIFFTGKWILRPPA